MSKISVNNLIFCIEKLPCNGQSIHEKNNILSLLGLLKKRDSLDNYKKVESRAISFIVKQTKKNEAA